MSELQTAPAETAAAPCCGPTCCSTDSKDAKSFDPAAIQAAVREKYDSVARAVAAGKSGASAVSCCATTGCDPIPTDLYSQAETLGLPADAVLASLGCGNPTALAELSAGETVLDLGSGGGIDVLLSARRVGPTGKAYGLDQSEEMLGLALSNKAAAGATNVEFLRGSIESVPLPRATVDVVISNCVINLANDKRQAFAEAFRVLKPGGRLAISDIVFLQPIPASWKRSVALWTGCVAGALQKEEAEAILAEIGFEEIEITPTRVYRAEDAKGLLSEDQLAQLSGKLDAIDGHVAAAFVRAKKPAA